MLPRLEYGEGTGRLILDNESMRILKFSSLLFLPACSLLALGSAAHAQQAPIKIGETTLVPSVRIGYAASDNGFLTSENPIETSTTRLSPNLVWNADRGRNRITGTYYGNYAFSDEDELGFNDHYFGLNAYGEFSRRSQATVSARLNRVHEDIGTGFTRGVGNSSERVDYTEASLELGHRYGAAQARLNFRSGLDFYLRDYDGDRAAGSSRQSVSPYAELSYRLSGDTRGLLQARFTTTDFESDADRDDLQLFAGVSWAATGISGGAVRIGATQSDFADDRTSDTQAVARISAWFTPTTFSRFEASFNRSVYDENDAQAVLQNPVTDDLVLNWNHNWSSRVRSVARINRQSIERGCPADDEVTIGGRFEVNFRVRRYLSFGFGAQTSNRTSTLCNTVVQAQTNDLDYDSSGAFVHMDLSL